MTCITLAASLLFIFCDSTQTKYSYYMDLTLSINICRFIYVDQLHLFYFCNNQSRIWKTN